jgi:transcriptional regulator with XRE-family HTH domain
MSNKEIGKRMKTARENAGLTQDDAAKVINSTFQKVSSFETGRTRIDIETLVKLCSLYKTNTDYILNPELNKKAPSMELAEDEQYLVESYRKLSHDDQVRAIERIDTILEISATKEEYEEKVKRA